MTRRKGGRDRAEHGGYGTRQKLDDRLLQVLLPQDIFDTKFLLFGTVRAKHSLEATNDDFRLVGRIIVDISYTHAALVKLFVVADVCSPPFSCLEQGHPTQNERLAHFQYPPPPSLPVRHSLPVIVTHSIPGQADLSLRNRTPFVRPPPKRESAASTSPAQEQKHVKWSLPDVLLSSSRPQEPDHPKSLTIQILLYLSLSCLVFVFSCPLLPTSSSRSWSLSLSLSYIHCHCNCLVVLSCLGFG